MICHRFTNIDLLFALQDDSLGSTGLLAGLNLPSPN